MSKPRSAVLYLRTEHDRLSPQEVDQLAAIKQFAGAQGWTLTGACIEQRSYHKRYEELREEFEQGEYRALIMWDEEHGYPGVWEGDFPVL